MPSARHSTVADPPVNRTVERSAEGGEEAGGVRDREGGGDGGVGVDRDVGGGSDAAKALRTAASSSGRLCAAPPAPSESALANCQAPSAPAAVPTATHAAVTTAFRHFLIPPLCRIVS
ncbi:hypothetical protein DEJ48_18420 [Streptomyces venezuelae]|uniref:Uncharacterized protein n=1 Tax=Streptomyces venezuelae TaxID=54571 RepID=A0A5P2BXA4_STRVZ|nr:hypothetical protein DEJ48_18420 [Streptomyces venezuelae]